MKKWIWGIIIAVIIIVQLIPSGRPEVIENNASDLVLNHHIPDSVTQVLRNACYDCHSNETKYPWYAYVAPVSWLVSRDTRMGREHLNFSDWEKYSKMDKAKQLSEIAEEVEDGTMPMPIYVLMHPEAKLTKAQREMLMEWSDEFAESLFE
jgi:hypothetical protein